MASTRIGKPSCPIPGCTNTKMPYQLMCRSHWYAVPNDVRKRVWNEYRTAPGSVEHHAAIRDAYASILNFVDATNE